MVSVRVISREGDERTLDIRVGDILMEAIRDDGSFSLQAMCGGSRACATCHVHVDPDYLGCMSMMHEDEQDLLSSSDYCTETSRLSCQIVIVEELEGLTVTVAPED